MAIEKQEYSQIGLTRQRSRQADDELRLLVPPSFNSLGSPSFTREVIIIDDDDEEKETLEPKKKKPRLGSWWDDTDSINELSCVIKGLPKSKDASAAASVADSWFSSTNLPETKTKNKTGGERSLSSRNHDNFLDLCSDDEGYSDSIITSNNKDNQDREGYGHVSVEDSTVSVEEPCLGGSIKDKTSPVDSCFSSPDPLEKETDTNKDHEKSLSSSHHADNFIDLTEDDENVCESINSSNRGYRHVTLEELGVTVEDLKNMPWEAFDPTWEIRSETMDPWLGGYVNDLLFAHSQ